MYRYSLLTLLLLLPTLSVACAPAGQGIAYNPLQRADEMEAQGDIDGAIAEYTKVIEIEPQEFYAYGERARLRGINKKDYDGAIADYTKVIELRPRDYAYYYADRAHMRKLKGDTDGAIADYDKVVELKPRDTLGYYLRAYARREKGDADGAVADFTKIIELEPENASAYRSRGDLLKAKGDRAGAEADYAQARAIKDGPDRGANKLTLLVEVTEKSELLLNGERRDPQTGAIYGTVNNPAGLLEKIAKVFKERKARPGPDVSAPGTNEVVKTVFIKAPKSMPYAEVVKVIDAVKAAGASPVGLQADTLKTEDNNPEEKGAPDIPEERPSRSFPFEKPHIDIPMETAPAETSQPISSKEAIVISIKKDGFYLGDKKYTFDIKAKDDPERKRLMRDLKQEVEKRPSEERIVYIKADADASYEMVVGMIDLIRDPEAGGTRQIGLVADRKRRIESESPDKRKPIRGRRH